MRTAWMLLAALASAPLASPAAGGGLVHRLPADQTAAKFDLKVTTERNGMETTSAGSLTLSSVGQVDAAGGKARWIEFTLVLAHDGMERTIIAKVLIPEKRLAKGETPIDHVIKGWLKQGEGEVAEMNDARGQRGGPLPVFLSGPLDDAKKLDAVEIESALGKLSCPGVSGRKKITQDQDELIAQIEARTHGQAPFGVVTARIGLEVSRGGQLRQKLVIDLKLAKVKQDATSRLPQNQ
jgi:hypothetical protein